MPRPKKYPYSAILKLAGETYLSKGITVMDVIRNLTPRKGRGIGVLTVIKEGIGVDRLLHRVLVRRLFSEAPHTREVALKQVTMLFNL